MTLKGAVQLSVQMALEEVWREGFPIKYWPGSGFKVRDWDDNVISHKTVEEVVKDMEAWWADEYHSNEDRIYAYKTALKEWRWAVRELENGLKRAEARKGKA